MLEKMIEHIYQAESEAEEIRETGKKSIAKLELDNQIQIEMIREDAEFNLKEELKHLAQSLEHESFNRANKFFSDEKKHKKVSADKTEKAKNFIIAEFYKRIEL